MCSAPADTAGLSPSTPGRKLKGIFFECVCLFVCLFDKKLLVVRQSTDELSDEYAFMEQACIFF